MNFALSVNDRVRAVERLDRHDAKRARARAHGLACGLPINAKRGS